MAARAASRLHRIGRLGVIAAASACRRRRGELARLFAGGDSGARWRDVYRRCLQWPGERALHAWKQHRQPAMSIGVSLCGEVARGQLAAEGGGRGGGVIGMQP